MPFYDYVCDNCGFSLNVLQKRSDPGPGKCKECAKGAMVRQISSCGFSLSGSGWYKDGYGSNAKAKTDTVE